MEEVVKEVLKEETGTLVASSPAPWERAVCRRVARVRGREKERWACIWRVGEIKGIIW